MDLIHLLYHFIVFYVNFLHSSESQYTDKWTEKSLIKDLLRDYEKRARPVVDGMSPELIVGNTTVQQITVAFGLGLIQILQLNENEQILTVSVRSLYRWTDYHLVWNPEEYENITHLNIPTDKIWLPDIALYNYADERLEERRECAVRVDHNGVVEWHPMAIYKSTCPVKIKYFPYDKQVCYLRFGPWTFDSARVNITFYDEGFSMKDYVESPEWSVLNYWQKHRTHAYPCCPEQYSDTLFYIKIERQAAYYNYILILPCFLLSSLTLVLFWLPPETPAKMVLGMNIFLAFFLLLLLLENSIPSASSSFPLIGNYYCINMTLVTLSTFLCLIVVNLHFRGDRRTEVPFWLRKLALHHGSRILLVNVGPPGGPPSAPPASSNKTAEKTTMNMNSAYNFMMPPTETLLHGNSFHPKMFPPTRGNFNEKFNDNRFGKPYANMFYHPECCYNSSRQPHIKSQFLTGSPNQKLPGCYYQDNESEMKHASQYSRRQAQVNNQTTPCSFCPACAGLAAAAAAASVRAPNDVDPGYYGEQQYSMQTTPKNHFTQDSTNEFSAVWAAAINDSKIHQKRLSTSGLIENNRQCEDEEDLTDDEDDEPHPTRSRNMGSDLEHFLLQCIKPGTSQKAVSAATAKWNSSVQNTQPTSPLYPFTSPICQDDSENEQYKVNLPRWSSAGHSIGGRSNRGLNHNSDKEINHDPDDVNLWRANSSSFISPKFKKSSNDIDQRLLKRVHMVTRDVSEIVKGIRFMQKQNEKKEKNNKIISEWRAVGMVLDRLFFIIYLCALGISILLYFPRSGEDSEETT
ncbi:Neuronal acetylcholine receptor subunit alpha-2 [Schistosoma japonicum]|nr:Neuronal acetylcholine receptor subunit alpha-2 [Schistosoma japonicum]